MNVGDEEKVKESAKKSRLAKRGHFDDIRAVLELPAGKRLIWRILKKGNAYDDVCDVNPTIMAINAGIHRYASSILKEIREAVPGFEQEMFKIEMDEKGDDDA